MKQNNSDGQPSLEEAIRFIGEDLGHNNFVRPRKHAPHGRGLANAKRVYRLPRKWVGRETELHTKLNEQIVPCLQKNLRTVPVHQLAEVERLLAFAKGLKCTLKSAMLKTSSEAVVVSPPFTDAREGVVEVLLQEQKVA